MNSLPPFLPRGVIIALIVRQFRIKATFGEKKGRGRMRRMGEDEKEEEVGKPVVSQKGKCRFTQREDF